jgi:tetratricopeptide (TPR) repeat protein
MKLGEYLKAEKVIEEILRIDRLNKVALNNKKELIEFGVLKKDNNIKIYIAFTFAAVFAIMIFVFRDNLINHIIDSKKGEKTVVESKDITSNNDKNVNDKKELISSRAENSFSSENLTRSIEESDYEGIYNIISKVEVKGLTEAENNLIAKAKEQLLQKGIEYFYNKGREAYSNKNYRESMKSFIKAYEFGEESYLYSHITFMLGATYESLNDINNTIKYYNEYDVKYPNGDYEQTVLYELTLIYKNIDNNKCKSYAEKLVRLYPKSIYNNTTIKGILLR